MKRRFIKPFALLLAAALSLACLAGIALASGASGSTSNTAPIAENLEFDTFRGVAITGNFKGFDPDGDALTYEITELPKKGSVVQTRNGEFTYTPNEKGRGRDTFTYVAVDTKGGVSASAAVTVNIKRQSTRVAYSDMAGHAAHYAALMLAEKGIFTGETLGGESFFKPDATVTRGEFLAMCLSVTGTRTIDVTRTGFADDDSIPMWLKPYVSAGLMDGVISGSRNDAGRIVFDSESPITFTEAAVILNRALRITDVSPVSFTDSDTVPAWAHSAAMNVTSTGIIPSGLAGIADNHVTRGDAALMLLRSMDVLAARETRGGLLGWAR